MKWKTVNEPPKKSGLFLVSGAGIAERFIWKALKHWVPALYLVSTGQWFSVGADCVKVFPSHWLEVPQPPEVMGNDEFSTMEVK